MKTLLALVLATALSLAAAQVTLEDAQIYTAMEIDATIIDCPPYLELDPVPVCLEVWGNHDLTAAKLSGMVRYTSDMTWIGAWTMGRTGDSRYRGFMDDHGNVFAYFLQPWRTSHTLILIAQFN